MKADSLISDRVMDSGIVNPAEAAKGCGEVNVGLADRYVFNGLACVVAMLAVDTIYEHGLIKEEREMSPA